MGDQSFYSQLFCLLDKITDSTHGDPGPPLAQTFAVYRNDFKRSDYCILDSVDILYSNQVWRLHPDPYNIAIAGQVKSKSVLLSSILLSECLRGRE